MVVRSFQNKFDVYQRYSLTLTYGQACGSLPGEPNELSLPTKKGKLGSFRFLELLAVRLCCECWSPKIQSQVLT